MSQLYIINSNNEHVYHTIKSVIRIVIHTQGATCFTGHTHKKCILQSVQLENIYYIGATALIIKKITEINSVPHNYQHGVELLLHTVCALEKMVLTAKLKPFPVSKAS